MAAVSESSCTVVSCFLHFDEAMFLIVAEVLLAPTADDTRSPRSEDVTPRSHLALILKTSVAVASGKSGRSLRKRKRDM